ncbi:MAG: hypothetical protein PHW79_11880, partial [Candidatus Marinimicrobia bacterium]|nr:hypothetical protein [Candidatus Neomarinimicrobiota bacterium]
KTWIWVAIGIGSVWGFFEALAGILLHDTPNWIYLGSIMTGVVAFFLAFGFSAIRKFRYLWISLAVVILFKMLDAALLQLPKIHMKIDNSVFGIVLEVLAMMVGVNLIRGKLSEKLSGKMLTGGLYAVLAVGLFPAVHFFTGTPACLMPGTNIPLSLYCSPIAIGLSTLLFPLGVFLGSRFKNLAPLFVPVRLRWALQGISVLMVFSTVLICI